MAQSGYTAHLCISLDHMDTLKTLGIAGFLFFLFKGLLWLVLFALVARGVIPEERVERIRSWFRWPIRKG